MYGDTWLEARTLADVINRVQRRMVGELTPHDDVAILRAAARQVSPALEPDLLRIANQLEAAYLPTLPR